MQRLFIYRLNGYISLQKSTICSLFFIFCSNVKATALLEPLLSDATSITFRITSSSPPSSSSPTQPQSSFSTFPMIFSSKRGKMASSSRTSSNTTPQSNSSLTFLK